MAKQSAGILVYRKAGEGYEAFLVHPDGPFWAKKDVWMVPKGELNEGEDFLTAAKREFLEEMGLTPPGETYIELGSSKNSSGKTDYIWAVEGDLDLNSFTCDSFVEMEWPPKSGQIQKFPEVDKAEWFGLSTAKQKVFKNQAVFFDRLAEKLHISLDKALDATEQSSLF